MSLIRPVCGGKQAARFLPRVGFGAQLIIGPVMAAAGTPAPVGAWREAADECSPVANQTWRGQEGRRDGVPVVY